MAAISLSCAFNPGDKVFSEMQGLGKLLENKLDQHRLFLQSVDDPRICCIMFHVATPGIGEGVDLMLVSFGVAQELRPSIGSKTFAEQGRAMRSNRTERPQTGKLHRPVR